MTGIAEFDRVLGGGIVAGSLVLVGGAPGIGKSTLLLQLCAHVSRSLTVLYVSGEESESQLKMRAVRLGVPGDKLYVLSETSMDDVLETVDALTPDVVVIDSISKRFSACGARVGCVISHNKEFMAQVMKWCQCRLASATVDQIAAAALYGMDPSYFEAVRDEYRLRRDTMVKKLKEIPGVICDTPKGAFYVMCALPVDDADKFQMWLLNEFNDNGETVLFACGEPFYATPGRGVNEVRLAYTINAPDIARAIDILKIAIEKYNNR